MHRIPPELTITIPPDRIAQFPASSRDESKLLVYDRKRAKIIHTGIFRDIVDFIAGDMVILNDSRVLPVRLEGVKPGGGRVELLFTTIPKTEAEKKSSGRKREPGEAGVRGLIEENNTVLRNIPVNALIKPGRRLKPDIKITLPGKTSLTLKTMNPEGGWNAAWSCEDSGYDYSAWLSRFGKAPLPPYIRRKPQQSDLNRYQTVYAAKPGSLAAPTAGLHITNEILDDLARQGSVIERITLHVGTGTFTPIKSKELDKHHMHCESYDISEAAAESINSAKVTNRRVTAIGTTVVRALETAAAEMLPLQPQRRSSNIFIYPPYSFRIIDRLVTNFHRPDSTLIQLVAAMIGWQGVNLVYDRALEDGYRFFSYGDSMLII